MSYQDLDVWKRSRALAKLTYELTAKFPREEQFGLTSQMRRSSVSVVANIAEGYGRNSPRAFAMFLRTSKGSLNELEALVILSEDFGFLDNTSEVLGQIAKLSSMLTNFIKKLETDQIAETIAEYSVD